MTTLPATYLEVRIAFMRRGLTFREHIAEPLEITTQHVMDTLRTYWGRTDIQPKSEMQKHILARAETLIQQHAAHGGAQNGQEPYQYC
jgi:hypothetical protein